MALIQCPECGKEISDLAPACIHCGFPLETLNPKWNSRCLIDGKEYDFSEMLRIYHTRSRSQSVSSFNDIMKRIEKDLGKDRNKQLRVFLLHYITDHGGVPASIIRSELPPQDPKDALAIGKIWMEQDVSGPLRCPRCGSPQVYPLKDSSILWNFIGTGGPKNLCGACGHKFRP